MGIMYMVAQLAGGMIAAALSFFILDTDTCHHVIVQPITIAGDAN